MAEHTAPQPTHQLESLLMKHAFVTGGGGDIGAAIGARALAAGYQVVLVDQDGARAQQQAATL
jgi:NAD(P)-dependent dehydrogenase (short-subunit alcohol dehydrogenase family)